MPARREQRVARDRGPVATRKFGAPAEDVPADGVDAIENPVAAGQDSWSIARSSPASGATPGRSGKTVRRSAVIARWRSIIGE